MFPDESQTSMSTLRSGSCIDDRKREAFPRSSVIPGVSFLMFSSDYIKQSSIRCSVNAVAHDESDVTANENDENKSSRRNLRKRSCFVCCRNLSESKPHYIDVASCFLL
ncbi:hypothetical protein AVEN_74906-1 [Araneus ventricosus]|uniref:Uncharacterized protein n=1 Tax=Araneus ventricosus TaxID=182803 RepID=A0A4Y2U5T0_ARAVE|nr:hypothetical protein AVEN_74906-1 [Araneus ventricosus]